MTAWPWVALVLVTACGGNADAPIPIAPPPPESPAGIDRAVIAAELDAVRAIAEHACACADTACLTGVDAELAAYSRVSTMNDPITDVETWPADLDAMGHAAMFRMVACMIDHAYLPTSGGIGFLRKRAMIRDAACACEEAPCAVRVRDAHERAVASQTVSPFPIDEPSVAALDATSQEIRDCLGGLLAQQAMLDLKALRADACACVDVACVEAVRERAAAWGHDHARTPMGAINEDELVEVAAQLEACLTPSP